jgi:hypothetical protein
MQLGVRNDEAAALAEQHGLKVVMNRCPKIEYGRLSSEIAWMGVNTRTLSSKRAKVRVAPFSGCRLIEPQWQAARPTPRTAPSAATRRASFPVPAIASCCGERSSTELPGGVRFAVTHRTTRHSKLQTRIWR